MNKSLYVLLLLASPSLTAPEVKDSLEEDLEEHAVSGVSGEHLLDSKETRRLDLEDSMEWSESTEVLDENHAWYPKSVRSRRKRFVEEESEQVEEKGPSEILASRYMKSSGEDNLETEDHAEKEMSEELQDYQESSVSDEVDSLEGRVSMEVLEQNGSRRKRSTNTEEEYIETRHDRDYEEYTFSQEHHEQENSRRKRSTNTGEVDIDMHFDQDYEEDTGSQEDQEQENSRRKRSLKEEGEDLEAAESVKRTCEECRAHEMNYRNSRSKRQLTPRLRCNECCCFIVV